MGDGPRPFGPGGRGPARGRGADGRRASRAGAARHATGLQACGTRLPPLRLDPFGGPGRTQISASAAAIVCAAFLARRKTGLALGPPSASEVARAPPRPPAPSPGFLPPTHPQPSTPVFSPLSRCALGFWFLWPSPLPTRTLPRAPGFFGLPSAGSPKPHAPHPQVFLCTLFGVLTSPPPTLMLKWLQPWVPSAHPALLPAPSGPVPSLLHQSSGVSCSCRLSRASAIETYHPFTSLLFSILQHPKKHTSL